MSVFITQNVSFVLTRPNLLMFRQRGSGYQLEMAKMQRTTFQAGIAWTGILAFAALGLFLLAREEVLSDAQIWAGILLSVAVGYYLCDKSWRRD